MTQELNFKPMYAACMKHYWEGDIPVTPSETVCDMLDLLPADFWSNPDSKVLDVCCSQGYFLKSVSSDSILGCGQECKIIADVHYIS